MFLDHAEDMARQKIPLYMKNWVASLDEFLAFRKRSILQGRGKISNAEMERLALAEYAKYNTRRLKAPNQTDEDDFSFDDLNEAAKTKE